MDYAQLINAVEAALAPLVEAEGGTVEIVQSLGQARAALDNGPSRWRVILHWEGYGDHEHARQGMTNHQVATVIQAPRGLAKSQHATKDKPDGTKSFSHYLECVSAWMRAMRFPDGTNADSAGFQLANSQWLDTVPNHDAHVIAWRLPAAHPEFKTQTIPLEFPHLNP